MRVKRSSPPGRRQRGGNINKVVQSHYKYKDERARARGDHCSPRVRTKSDGQQRTIGGCQGRLSYGGPGPGVTNNTSQVVLNGRKAAACCRGSGTNLRTSLDHVGRLSCAETPSHRSMSASSRPSTVIYTPQGAALGHSVSRSWTHRWKMLLFP